MIYLNDKDVKGLKLNWGATVQVIEEAIECLKVEDTAQPIKPYLRYNDPKNRIIAMPAFVGGNIQKAGIKWIASFPDNIKKGISRAHSVVILNEAETGIPVGILNSGSISAIRTASVSGFMIKQFSERFKSKSLKIGIIGFGPIGQYHLNMCEGLLGDAIGSVTLYDLKGINKDLISSSIEKKVTLANSWQEAYKDADIFITCTVSKDRYIDERPKKGSLHLNVSLRDYKTDVYAWFSEAIIVDNWEEICRQNTDIEMFHKTKGLLKNNVKEIQELLDKDEINTIDEDQPVMFNPMGMAVFDIAISNHYILRAMEANVGSSLDD